MGHWKHRDANHRAFPRLTWPVLNSLRLCPNRAWSPPLNRKLSWSSVGVTNFDNRGKQSAGRRRSIVEILFDQESC